jgi:hypothetical protein
MYLTPPMVMVDLPATVTAYPPPPGLPGGRWSVHVAAAPTRSQLLSFHGSLEELHGFFLGLHNTLVTAAEGAAETEGLELSVGVVEGHEDELEHGRGGEVHDALAGGVELVEPGRVGADGAVLVEGHAQGGELEHHDTQG